MTWFIADRLGVGLGELAELEPRWWSPHWLLFVSSCGALLVANFFSGLIWRRMVADLGGPILPPGTAIRVFLVANLGRYVPGKVWQVAGLVLLAKRHGVPVATATGAAVIGHALSLASATVVGGAVFVEMGQVGAIDAWWVPVAVVVAVAIGMTPPVFRRAMALWVRLARHDADTAPSSRQAAGWIPMFIVVWLAYGASFVILARSFGVPGSPLAIAPAFVAAYVIGYVAIFAPAGIGVREVALTGLLAPTTGASAALGLAVVARVWATVVEVLPGAVLASREATLDRRRSRPGPER